MLSEAYEGEAVKTLNVFEWYKRFIEDREKVEDDKRSVGIKSQRTDKNVKKVRNLVHSGRCLSISQAYYVEILKWLREAVRRKWPQL
jgi:hypothetical protein